MPRPVSPVLHLAWSLIAISTCCILAGQQAVYGDDEFESLRGLVAEYRDNTGGTLQRVDADLQFNWETAAPHPLIDPQNFSVRWRGMFLQREEGPFRFHTYLSGRMQVTIGDQLVLQADAPRPQWCSGPQVSLPPGFHPIEVTFEKRAPSAQVSLYWSSGSFPLEPVSTFLFSHDAHPHELDELERGRILYDAHRCNRCHQRAGEEPSDPAPALWGVAQGLNPQWLIAKLKGTHPEAPHANMPHFGLTDEDATAVAAFLTRLGAPHQLSQVPEIRRSGRQQLPTGRELIVSLGCLACHTVGELGHTGPYAGGDLTRIGAKRSAEWLSTWLSQPEKLNPQHRMPVFKLTPTERALLVNELSSLRAPEDEAFRTDDRSPNFTPQQVDRGRDLVKSLRCANCHKIPAIEADVRGLSTLQRPVSDWDASCLGDQADRSQGRPAFPHADRQALRRFVESRFDRTLHPLSLADRGRLVLQRRNCLECHERDGAAGIVKTAGQVAAQYDQLRGQSEALIPPNLTAVGDKLLDEALAVAVSGEQKEPRLPWLKVRMPRFHHSEEEKRALVAAMVHHDRIPVGAPEQLKLTPVQVDDETLLLGRRLVGVGGFTCIACHKIGDYEPRNAALGTRGSDLRLLRGRMRPEFFLRWTRSPLRIVPGMEMPSYLRPVAGILREDLQLQLSTLWGAISHPDFEAPTNPTHVEQFLVVQPGERPRVVRDVFALPENTGGGAVARAVAVGFDNGHSVLFDADTARIRAWTYGDFARQRTEGKSWYWDMAGTFLNADPAVLGELALRDPADGSVQSLTPVAVDRLARLSGYEVGRSSEGRDEVRLSYVVMFRFRGKEQELPVREIWRGIGAESSSGWRRELVVVNPPEGTEPVLVRMADADARFNARLRSFSLPEQDFVRIAGAREVIAFRREGALWRVAVAYDCDLAPYAPPTAPAAAIPGVPAPGAPIANPVLDQPVTTLPGYFGRRLNVPWSVMPTALAYGDDGALYFTSLKGDVYRLRDRDGDGFEEELTLVEEGLAAPFGILPDGDSLLVAHKPELLRLRDTDGDGRCDVREVVVDGWGYTDNYHDWTTGPVRDLAGRLYLALGSDYSQPERPLDHARWRGKVLRVNSDGTVEPIAHELRFPQGIAMDPQERLFVTDQQGHGNPFNELDHIVEGRHYGVPARLDEPREGPATLPAVQVPHPWTRSVNGLFFLPTDHNSPFAGHGIGCEYNGRFLVRFTYHEVQGELQGAVYPFSRTTWDAEDQTFLGPIGGTVAPNGDILVGSIHDSGWLGGLNTGEIVRLTPSPRGFPNGIREVRAVRFSEGAGSGLEIDFIHPIDPQRGRRADSYSVIGYTRIWQGSYATEDSGRYSPEIVDVRLSEDRRTVQLVCRPLKAGFVYEVRVSGLNAEGEASLFPDFAAYTLNRLP